MTIEEEKKLVIDFMGWTFKDPEWLTILIKSDGSTIYYENWNPQKERKWWDEIREKMDVGRFCNYIKYLEVESETACKQKDWRSWDYFFHTAKPSVCWKALIKTLEDHAI